MLLVFRLLIFVPIPLFNTDLLKAWIENNEFFEILNNFGGNALEQASILALGITPYITASIVVQMLQMVIPQLKEWQDQGESGHAKAARLTRYLAVVLAFAQGLMLIIGSSANATNVIYPGVIQNGASGWPYYILMALCITAGTCICIWISDIITKKGIGNGASLMITAGIVTSLPSMGVFTFAKFVTNRTAWYQIIYFVIIILLFLGSIMLVTFFQISERKIPVHYANRGGKSNSDIPLKINSANVMPVIFGSTIMSIPLTIAGFFQANSSSGAGYWLDQVFNNRNAIGFVLYMVLIIVFSFFYSFLQTSPDKISENLSKSNAFIPGIRPGEDTKNYVAKLLFKITVIGTVYLMFIAALPLIICKIFNLPNSISVGGTSLLIVVGVAIETCLQIVAEGQKDEYQGIY
jgi:preprotein translocase subunit SecY